MINKRYIFLALMFLSPSFSQNLSSEVEHTDAPCSEVDVFCKPKCTEVWCEPENKPVGKLIPLCEKYFQAADQLLETYTYMGVDIGKLTKAQAAQEKRKFNTEKQKTIAQLKKMTKKQQEATCLKMSNELLK